jgi:hypothetical protein
MPRADVIDLEQRRRGHTRVTLHGADQLQALFSELEAHIEAMPFLREEYRLRFPNDEALVMSSQAPVVNGGALLSMAPTAKLLAWRERCRRLARARGLRVQVDPPPAPGPDLAEAVERLMDQHGCDARLIDVAKALGLASHAHAMGQGQGPL